MTTTSSYPPSICPGIPKLGPCPPGWSTKTFGQLLRVVERPIELERNTEYQLVTAKRNRGGIVPRERLNGQDIKTAGQYIVRKGDFLIANRQVIHGACGIVPPALDGAIVSGEYTVTTAVDDIFLPWFAYFAHTPYFQTTCFHSSIGVDVEKMVFKLDWWLRHSLHAPPLPEQEKIAETLSTWDAAIEQTRALIAATKQQKNALAQQLLTGKRRLPGFKRAWSSQSLGTLFTEREECNRPDLPLLAITGTQGIVLASDLDRKDASSADKRLYKRICPGDIGYNTMRMWQGVNAVSPFEGIVSPAYTVCIPGPQIAPDFVKHLFKFQPVVYTFWRNSQGLVDDTLSLKYHNFARIKIRVPNPDEQQAIADVLGTADAETLALEAKCAALETQKKGLMQKLLTGEVRVKV